MIPQVLEDLKGDFTFAALPSRTFRMRHDTRSIVGTVDQIKAVEQAIFLILNVERYEWLIYSWNYGVELKQLFGKPIEFIKGLETCNVTSLLIPGENEEDTEAFRQRYFDSLNTQAFGGNRMDYIQKVSAIPGVGGVKVYRAWNSDVRPAE